MNLFSTMKAARLKFIIALACCVFALKAYATVVVSFEPAAQSIAVGNATSVDLVISGLGNQATPALGAFSFDLSYDPAVLSAGSVTFGNHLNLGSFGSLRFSDLSTTGAAHLDEVSFESATDLIAAQPSSFTLATLVFTGIAPGVSTLGFSLGSLSDENGQSLSFITAPGELTVTGRASVPDAGSTWVLLGLALLLTLQFRRARPHSPHPAFD